MQRILKFWFPLWAYSAIIFFLSSVPSTALTITHGFSDKVLHVLEFGPLGFFWIRALANTRAWPRLTLWLVSVLGCYVYGLTDEFHQLFVPGRECTLWDAAADFLGAGIGAGIYLIVQQQVNVKKEV